MKFELVRVFTSDESFSLVIPREFFGFEAADTLEVHNRTDGEEFIRLSHLANVSSVYLMRSSGVVFAGISLDELVFANTSLNDFNECVREMIARYPYYGEDSEPDEWTVSAESVGQAVYAIDPPAMAGDAFWNEFKWDVVNGDYY